MVKFTELDLLQDSLILMSERVPVLMLWDLTLQVHQFLMLYDNGNYRFKLL